MCRIAAAGKAFTLASGKKYFVSNPIPMVRSDFNDVHMPSQFTIFDLDVDTRVLLLLQPWPAHC
jgi:hypothetical protein